MSFATDEIHRLRSMTDHVRVRAGTHVACPDPACPSHGKGKKRCRVKDRGWHCFYCDLGGDIFTWVMLTQGVSFREALVHLAEETGVALKPDPERSEWLQQVVAAASRYLQNHPEKRIYLEQERGLPSGLVSRQQLGYVDEDGEVLRDSGLKGRQLLQLGLLKEPHRAGDRYWSPFAGFYLLPIRNSRGEVVSLKGRLDPASSQAGERAKSYCLPSDPDHAPKHWGRTSAWDYLYLEEQLAEARRAGILLLAEGEFDALTGVALGFPTVGVPGNHLARFVSRLGGIARIYDVGDNDDATEAKIPQRLWELQMGQPQAVVYRTRLPELAGLGVKCDLNDFAAKFGGGRQELKLLLRTSPSAYSVLCDVHGPTFDQEESFMRLRRLYHIAPAALKPKMLAKLADVSGHSPEMLRFALDPASLKRAT